MDRLERLQCEQEALRRHLKRRRAGEAAEGHHDNALVVEVPKGSSASEFQGFRALLVDWLLQHDVEVPIDSGALQRRLSKVPAYTVPAGRIEDLLNCVVECHPDVLGVEEHIVGGEPRLVVVHVDMGRLYSLHSKLKKDGDIARALGKGDGFATPPRDILRRRRRTYNEECVLEVLLEAPTVKERQEAQVGQELGELLSKPTIGEQFVVEKFKSKGGSCVVEFCPSGTKERCRVRHHSPFACEKTHFRKIILPHTDPSLGACPYLDTCRRMHTCRFIHYELDEEDRDRTMRGDLTQVCDPSSLRPAQWIQCDIRNIVFEALGDFAVIMLDPPWDIHMELPYGTMTDDEMRALEIRNLQSEGVIFLWMTGRVMELGREILEIWGYQRVDEVIWVKTNQLQRIIRTGRTGHWLNHSKEHCLVGIKGNPPVNRHVDCDVIVSEVRDTSRKPDEIYGIIERMCPNTRKIELFGRMHNTRPGWLTLGNQVDGVRLSDTTLKKNYEEGRLFKKKPSEN